MEPRTFARQLTTQLARRFPQSNESVYSYHHETMVRSEERAPFDKIAIVIDSELEPDVARYLLGNILQAFHAKQEFREIYCGLQLWNGASFASARPARISRVMGNYDALIPTRCETGPAESLFAMVAPLCKQAAQTIFLIRKEKWAAMQSAHFPYCRRSMLVYPTDQTDEAARAQTLHNLVSLGLDCENRVAFTPPFAHKCMSEFECFAVGTQYYRRDDKMKKAASYADKMYWMATANPDVADSLEAQKETLDLCEKIHEMGWKYLIVAGKIGPDVKTDLRFGIMVPAFGQDKTIRGPFPSYSVVEATFGDAGTIASCCEALWRLPGGQRAQMVGHHIPGNATTDVPLFISRGELL